MMMMIMIMIMMITMTMTVMLMTTIMTDVMTTAMMITVMLVVVVLIKMPIHQNGSPNVRNTQRPQLDVSPATRQHMNATSTVPDLQAKILFDGLSAQCLLPKWKSSPFSGIP